MRTQTQIHTANGFLAPPPERPGTPMRAPDTVDWLAETIIPQAQTARLTLPEPTAAQRTRANVQLATLGLCVGAAMGVWVGLIPAAALTRTSLGLTHGALAAYGFTSVALALASSLPSPDHPALASGRVGDLAMAAGVAAGVAFDFALCSRR